MCTGNILLHSQLNADDDSTIVKRIIRILIA